MTFITPKPRHANTSFVARNARFVIPACWLVAAATWAVDAMRTDATGAWLGAAGCAGMAVLDYVGFRRFYLKRLKDARRDGTG
jgi:hypothetical protein